MKLLCIHGIPSRGLHEGRIYTQLGTANCKCLSPRKPWPLVSVAESVGRTRSCYCIRCKTYVPPNIYNGWYAQFRFIPVEPPKDMKDDMNDITDDEHNKILNEVMGFCGQG